MQQEHSLSDSSLKEITQLLKINKQLVVVDQQSEYLGFGYLLHVKDINEKQYSLLIVTSQNTYNYHTLEHKASHFQNVQKKVNFLKIQDSPYLAKCYDAFMLEKYYIILLEKFICSLSKKIPQDSPLFKNAKLAYSEVCTQMLQGAKALHKRKYTLDHVSALNSFAITADLKIKLINFEEPYQIQYSDIQQQFNSALKNRNLFYYLPETLKIPQKDQYHIIEEASDIWCLGICFYHLAGASVDHILKYIQEKETFQSIPQLQLEINAILINILVIRQENKYRPSIRNMIKSFTRPKQGDFKFTIYSQQKIEKENTELIEGIEKYHNSQKKDYDYFNTLITKFENYLDYNRQSDVSHMYLGILNSEKYQYQEAKFHLGIALSINPHNDQAYFEFGKLCYENREIDIAFSYFDKAIRINRNQQRQVEILLGSNFFNYVPKKVSLNSIESQFISQKSFLKEASSHMKAKRYKQAYYSFVEALYHDTPEETKAVEELLLKFCQSKNFAGQNQIKLNLLRILIEKNSNNNKVYETFNSLSFKEKQLQKSIEFYENQIDKNFKNDVLYYYFAHLYQQDKSFEKVNKDKIITNLEKALKINPSISSAYLELNGYYYELQKRIDYVRFYKQAIKYCDNKSYFYGKLGFYCQNQLSLYQQAKICYKKQLELNDEYLDLQKLQNINYIQKKYEAGMKQLTQYIKTSPINLRYQPYLKNDLKNYKKLI